MKTYQFIDPNKKPVKLKISDYRLKRASAFACGTMNSPYDFEYLFEVEAFEAGQEQTKRIKEEVALGLR